MIERVTIRPSAYYDSVTLMLVSREIGELAGVEEATAVTGTPLNLSLLEQQGYGLPAGAAGPNDLVIAIRAADEATADAALAALDARLKRSQVPVATGTGPAEPRSLTSARRVRPELNLAFLSVPGPYVAYEAALALRAGAHVFCFSDGVPVEQEVWLKSRALDHGLLFMGPDCGTAVLDGVALGFANVVEPGPVGLVGASGTGMQQVMCLIDAAGLGISQAIGVGGRDLSKAVGGRMTARALELLDGDDATEIAIVVSKPPDGDVARRIAGLAAGMSKPVVLAFVGRVGGDGPVRGASGEVTAVDTLEQAAAAAATRLGAAPYAGDPPAPARGSGGHIRGLFCGGTLCDEAMAIVSESVGRVASNIPLRPEWGLADLDTSVGHTFVDFGEDQFTQGRAHPMIDPALRTERFVREARDPEVGVVLLDVILGHCAHPDPAASLAPRIAEALETRGGGLQVVVSLCGTERDPQDLARQRSQLESAGALVARSNAHASRIALAAIGGAVMAR